MNLFKPIFRRWPGIFSKLPWLILTICLSATYLARQLAIEIAYRQQERELEFQTLKFKLLLEQRLNTYRQILISVNGLFQASEQVERGEFRDFIATLDLAHHYPGVQVIGYTKLIHQHEKQRHIDAIRREGFPDYKIFPETGHSLYAPVLYIEPFSGANLRAFGFDLFSESSRKRAMLSARDSNDAIITAKVKLVQEPKTGAQPGFLMYLPVYTPRQPHQTLAERQANITGWVSAGFRMLDFLQPVVGGQFSELGISIYDGDGINPDSLLFASQPGLPVQIKPRFEFSNGFTALGHRWTLHFHSTPLFEAKARLTRGNDITVAGAGISLLIAMLVWQIINVRDRASKLAHEMTSALSVSEAKAKSALAEVKNQQFALDQHAIVARTDLRGTITYANALFCAISGYSRDELIGQNHRLINSGLHPREFFTGMYKTISAGQVWRGEIRNKAKNGHYYWVLTTIVPILDDLGKPVEYIALRSDITESKRFEQELFEANWTLQNVLNAASEVAIVATDANGIISLFNKGAEKMFGYSAHELIGKHSPMIFYVKEEIEQRADELSREFGVPVDGFEVFTRKAVLRGQDQKVWTYVRKDGYLLKCSMMISPICHEGNKVEGFLAIVRDTTTEYLAQNALQKSEAKLRSLFELSPVGIVLTDMEGRYLEFNQAFARICGYTEDELKALDYWTLTPKEYYDAEQDVARALMETGHYGPFEKEYRRKDGSLIPIRLNGVLVTDKDNKQFVWSIIEDISISREMEDNLRQAKLAAEKANQIKSDIVATVSHELRTPLTSIQGAIDLLLGGIGGAIPDSANKLLNIASRNCKRLRRLLDNTLNLEKLEADKVVLKITAQDIIPLVNEVIESEQAHAADFNINLAFSHPGTPLHALIDRDAFVQALTNVLANAIKFAYLNSQVDIEAVISAGMARISVTNQGEGIQESFRDRIFEKFSQEDSSNSRKKGGTGLGLSITKALLEKMGGSIGFDSEPGQQTRFFFVLPLASVQP